MTYTLHLGMRQLNSMQDGVWRGVVNHPRTVLFGLLLITSFFLYQVVVNGLPLDNSPTSLYIHDDPALRRYNEAVEMFGDDNALIVALVADDIFTPNVIVRLRALTHEIERVDHIAQAISLTNIETARTSDDSLRVSPLIPETASITDLQRIAQEVEQDRFIVGNLVSSDRKMAAINLFFTPNTGGDAKKQAVARIERIVKSQFAEDRIYLAGLPYMNYRDDVHVTRDLMKFAPLTVLLIVITFYFAFHNWRGVIMPLSTVAVGLIWTFGTMTLMEKPLTLVTMMVPVIIMAIGSSYVIHVINQVYLSRLEVGDGSSPEAHRAAVLHALRFIAPAILISGLTTMAGFGSLAFTTIVGMRDMGIFNTVGVGATMILSLTLVPAWLVLLRPISPAEAHQRTNAHYLDPLLDWTGRIATRQQKWVHAVVLVATFAAVAGIARLTVNSDYLAFYPEGSEERVAAEMLHQHLGGAAAFQVIIDGQQPGALHRAEALNQVIEMQRFIESLPGINRTISIADLVMMTHRLLTTGRSQDEIIPHDQSTLDAIFTHLAESTSTGDVPIRFISDDGSQAQIMVRSNLFGSAEMDQALRQIETWAAANLPTGLTADPTGIIVLLNRTSDSVATQQARSLAIALLLIFAMMALLFRSLKTGVVALIPNVVPIVVFFGFMGWTGIPLNLNTSLVASIVLGLAVDNAAHLIRRYRQCCGLLADKQDAVRLSLQRTGKPVIFANLTLVFGFAIFALSAFVPVKTGGLLSAVTILACFVSDMVFLPVLMHSRLLQIGGEPTTETAAKSASPA